jgi:hypothetical protein
MMSAISTTTPQKFIGRGDFTKERHERPERSMEEIEADILRLEAEYPETLTINPVRWEREK